MPQLPLGIFLPSGLTIIGLMLINLTAAHLVRFRIQATGARLWLGLAVLVASFALTAAVIFNYQDDQGFGGQPPIPWERMWQFFRIAVLGLAIAAGYRATTSEQYEGWTRVSLWGVCLGLLAFVGWSVSRPDKAFIGDSAMRILWQLLLSTVAALAVLTGCYLLFRRKAGIVLLHLGIAGLLLNEIYVTLTNEELRISLAEGQTVHHAVDLRETEFVVIDRADSGFDQFTVLPTQMLIDSNQDVIDDPRLPFKIRCLEYFQNSNVIRVGPDAENKATAGIGRTFVATYLKPAAGASAGGEVNQAAAYVELIDRTNDQPIAVYLASQAAFEQDLLDTVELDGRRYQIGLRFKTVYTPFSIYLKDVSKKDYVGTDVPRAFSSEFRLDDAEHGVSSDQRIWMNNPLRYRDLTFYQVSYNSGRGVESTGIQVVRNRGWMIPYVCCMFVVVGLVVQFQQALSRYLSKGSAGASRDSSAVWPTVLLIGIFGLYYGGSFVRSFDPRLTKSKGSDIRLDMLGRLPVTHEGRVQPLDTYARSLARKLSKREELLDGSGGKQPAIRWLADTLFGVAAADGYEVLRIEDTNVQNSLELPSRRKGLKFTFSEIRAANTRLSELIVDAKKLAVEKWGPFEYRIKEVYDKAGIWLGAYKAFAAFPDKPTSDRLERLELAANLAVTQSNMPFAIPVPGEETESWIPLSIANERIWLRDLARECNAKSAEDLAQELLDAEAVAMRSELVRDRIISDLMQYEEIVELLTKRFELKTSAELAAFLARNWDQFPPEIYKDEQQNAELFVEAQLQEWKTSKFSLVVDMISSVNGGNFDVPPGVVAMVDRLNQLRQAYLDGDGQKFNKLLESHLASIETAQAQGWNRSAHYLELFYNHFSPFYVAMTLYLAAFVVTVLSWLVMRWPLNRGAFWLICFGLVVHVGGIVARVIISGRPPITNLYSSFVVVAASCVLGLVLIESVTRKGLGNLLAAAGGFLLLLYAWTLTIDQGDTFTVMRAVLDTQFWLSTHVIIINLGYGATLIAGSLGVGYLFRAFMGSERFDNEARRSLTAMIYGSVCFGLLFSFFGTVLGGLWADDSWGRFWGWDPKENGALMIVLWNAAILHARWAGLVRQRGLAALAVLGNVIVLWSWEGVNQLGVGLHAYADSSSSADIGTIFLKPIFYLQLIAALHVMIAIASVILPLQFFESNDRNASKVREVANTVS
jgi:ABC-type transport system involved in cytochrome c biogenesis permease subunit